MGDEHGQWPWCFLVPPGETPLWQQLLKCESATGWLSCKSWKKPGRQAVLSLSRVKTPQTGDREDLWGWKWDPGLLPSLLMLGWNLCFPDLSKLKVSIKVIQWLCGYLEAKVSWPPFLLLLKLINFLNKEKFWSPHWVHVLPSFPGGKLWGCGNFSSLTILVA